MSHLVLTEEYAHALSGRNLMFNKLTRLPEDILDYFGPEPMVRIELYGNPLVCCPATLMNGFYRYSLQGCPW
jgi:hypothetical protein